MVFGSFGPYMLIYGPHSNSCTRVETYREVMRAQEALHKVLTATSTGQLVQYLTDRNGIVRESAKEKVQELHRQWKPWWCWLLNKIDIRYWLCGCRYEAPYGKVISTWCRKHGNR